MLSGLTRWSAQWIWLKGGYFKSQTDLISRLLRAIVQELIPATTDADAMKVRFDARHFSGYLVAVTDEPGGAVREGPALRRRPFAHAGPSVRAAATIGPRRPSVRMMLAEGGVPTIKNRQLRR